MRCSPFFFLAITCCLIGACASSSKSANGPIYHKPEFRGRILDAETKSPIEGVVVVVMHWESPNIGGPGGPNSSIFKVIETTTDNRGEFHFPAFTTLISPISSDGGTEFIIYKPGYASYPSLSSRIYPLNIDFLIPEYFFSKELGSRGEIKRDDGKPVATVTFGIVELPRVTGKKDRLSAMPGSPSGFRSKELPLLFKAINEEAERFGLGKAY